MDKTRGTVIVLGGSPEQLEYILEIKRLGYKIVLTDLDSNAPGRRYADIYLQIGYEDKEGLLSGISKLMLSGECKVFTAASQFAHLGAAVVAKEVGFSYPRLETIEMCLNKELFYESFVSEGGISIPETLTIRDKSCMEEIMSSLDPKSHYFLKSDYGKSPNYIYRFKGCDVNIDSFFWGYDRYHRRTYLLQKEFPGICLRVNYLKETFIVFDFETGRLARSASELRISGSLGSDMFTKLKSYVLHLGLQEWLVKFDVIVNSDGWACLDIGLDPPFRMKKVVDDEGYSFAKCYVLQMLETKMSYPLSNIAFTMN